MTPEAEPAIFKRTPFYNMLQQVQKFMLLNFNLGIQIFKILTL